MRLLLSLLLILPLSSFAAELPKQPVSVTAANERALVERLARLYAWRWLEPGDAEAGKAMATSTRQFDKQLAQLSAEVKTDAELTENYDLLAQQWQDYRQQTTAKPGADSARQVLESSEDMAWIAQKGSQLLAKRGNEAELPVRLAQDVAALSQRLAKIYLLQSAGLKVAFLGKDLNAARTEFEQTSRTLKALKLNTPSLTAQIELMNAQWFFFQQALDALAARQQDPQLRRDVFSTSERIYQVALALSQRYQEQATLALAKR